MAHCIQALVAELQAAAAFCLRNTTATVLALPQGLGIVPVESASVKTWTKAPVPQKTETFFYLTEEFMTFLKRESMHGRLAYIETEYFGGVGCEGATVLDNGTVLMEPIWEHDAILTALRHLGVEPQNDTEMFRFTDEAELLGIGRFRSNDKIRDAIKAAE